MSITEREASVVLEGDLRVASASVNGNGHNLGELPSSLMERLGDDNGKISPETLIASAYAADYAMTLASALGTHGNQPDRLDVSARCALDRTPDGLAITRMYLDVKGVVPRIESAEFEEMARKAEEKCLLSTAMRGNVEFEFSVELLPQ
jgi:lipoyl-dependent peroxiredoxin